MYNKFGISVGYLHQEKYLNKSEISGLLKITFSKVCKIITDFRNSTNFLANMTSLI